MFMCYLRFYLLVAFEGKMASFIFVGGDDFVKEDVEGGICGLNVDEECRPFLW